MRELERDHPTEPTDLTRPADAVLTIVGRGRVGRSLAAAGQRAGLAVRLASTSQAALASAGAEAILLCVPDEAIREACAAVSAAEPVAARVGHVSGATTLDPLESARSRGAATFSLHPLQTFADGETDVAGTPCAIEGSSDDSSRYAVALAERLGMRPFRVSGGSRAAYHAAASIASNLLVALEESAAELLARAGVADPRELLAPLVLRTAANWAERGPKALTGPIARGDRATVERHRAAIRELRPELLPLYEALAERAEAVAGSEAVAA